MADSPLRLRWAGAALLAVALSASAAPGSNPRNFYAPSAAVQAYLDQAAAARARGQVEEEKAILDRGIADTGADDPDSFWLYRDLRKLNADRGNLFAALAPAEKAAAPAPAPGMRFGALASLASTRAGLLDRVGAQAALDAMVTALDTLRSQRNWARNGKHWLAQAAWAKARFASNFGQLAAAENEWRTCLALLTAVGHDRDNDSADISLVDCTGGLVGNLLAQGRLAEAGALMASSADTVDQAARRSNRPGIGSRIVAPFVRVALEQGRFGEARRLAEEAIEQLASQGAGGGSPRLANLRLALAQIEMLEGQWTRAIAQHETRRDALQKAGRERGNRGIASPDYAYALLRAGRIDEAVEMMQRIVATREQIYDENSHQLWEGRAFLGLALAVGKQPDAALKILAPAVPRLFALLSGERSSTESGVLRAARLNWILDGYLALLARFASGELAPPGGFDPIEESFRSADLARGSTVQRALAAAASRHALDDPALGGLARREQDLQNELAAQIDALNGLLAGEYTAEQGAALKSRREMLAQLQQTHSETLGQLRARAPAYANLLDPTPVGSREIQRWLAPDEAMVAIYSGSERSYVWAVPASGAVRFASVPLGAAAVKAAVSTLREAFDSPGTELPRFDNALAHRLYSQLLAPVGAGWRDAKRLILVPHGELARLPFAVLLTAPTAATTPLAAAPWLIRQAALSQLPAAYALPLLRQGQRQPAPRPFVGFGDPVFSSQAAPALLRGGRRNLAIRPGTTAALADAGIAAGIDYALLTTLPDTAQEIREIAGALDADLERDVYLGQRASEANARRSDLSPYRVLMFATHGLVPGEMPGVYQPALALSNPALAAGGPEAGLDGMLTMEEILGLRLNADWVVLSACNTAAAGSSGAEALSGLGRAFFYAGARALLVTQWPVETVSARLLTTEIFRRQAADPAAPRTRLLQEAALAVMTQRIADQTPYAHPLFWAPYVIVGDGR